MIQLRQARAMSALALILAAISVPAAYAQSAGREATKATGAEALMREIVVTAEKKSTGTTVQKTPIAITAFGQEQLEALLVRDISALGFKAPNVSMDDIGTTKGVANFTIRGLGVNSSIPSIDPAVGVFVDGVYLGVNSGVVFDTFDLKSVEVLRGPQGVLFGRNVTGGAVLINTSDPLDFFHFSAKVSAESGLRGTGGSYAGQGVVTGPIVGDVLSAKLAVYYNRDEGWFRNRFDNSDFGKSHTLLIRPAVKFKPSVAITILLKYEHGDADGDGPAGQSHTNGSDFPGVHGNFSRDSFGFSIDERGYFHSKWDQVVGQIDAEVGPGKITNISAYRRYRQSALSDIDSSPLSLFHANIDTDQEQLSNELRYAARFFDRLDVTTGVFYFTQKLRYSEHRTLLGGALNQYGGGYQDQDTLGIFAAADYDVTPALSVNAGLRYSHEKKDDQIASLIRNTAPCNVVMDTCPFDFTGRISESTWSPKVGVNYEISGNARGYASWSRAYRAGGFNFRNTATDVVNLGPGPFGDEKVDSYETGIKTEPYRGARLNLAAFYTKIGDMQRELNRADPVSGVVQTIKNTADARLIGIEADFLLPVIRGVVVDGSVGYVDGKYTAVRFDLNGDGVIDAKDRGLDIPRLAPLTASIGLTVDRDIPGLGKTTTRVSYSHRDDAAYTDNNLGRLNQADRIDASLSIPLFDNRGALTIYGQNLTNDVQIGGDTQLPANLGPLPLGGTFAPLSRGRMFGIELKFAS
jgi:iron complex outermembrane receptor protein